MTLGAMHGDEVVLAAEGDGAPTRASARMARSCRRVSTAQLNGSGSLLPVAARKAARMATSGPAAR